MKAETLSHLQGTDALAKAVLESLGEGVIVIDTAGKVALLNRAAEEMMGWKSFEVVGRGVEDVIQKETEEGEHIPYKDYILKKILEGKEIIVPVTKPYWFKRRDGSRFPASLVATAVRYDNHIVGAVEVFRDVTGEQEVDRAKTEFVSLASHQLRTPLSAVNWYAEMLMAGDAGELNEKQRKYMDEIYHGNQRMVELVNALLNVSRLEMATFVVEPEPTNVMTLVRSVLDELKPMVDKKYQTLTPTFSPDLPLIPADPRLLRIVFQNLLSNAVKYSAEGGKVECAVSCKKETGRLSIRVSDNGMGIPQSQQNQIFLKLFRADNVRETDTEGTGLGLYIVKSIVEHSGGTIRFESIENKGTTFFVELPLGKV